MKVFGYCLICIGVIYLLIAFNLDVSISTSSTYIEGYGSVGGGNIANLDLMAQRQNHLLVASLITLIGALMAIFGKDQNEAEVTTSAARVEPKEFTGEHDLSSDAYRLWLVMYHQIERNEVFDRFVMGEQTYKTLDDAMIHAHALEVKKIADEKAEDDRVEAEVAANREFVRIAAEEADAQWAETKPKILVAIIIAIGLASAGYFLLKGKLANRYKSPASAVEATVKMRKAIVPVKVSPKVSPTQTIDPSVLATTDGMMGVAIGKSWDSVSSRFNLIGRYGSEISTDCEIYESRNQRVSAMVQDGMVTRIETSDRAFRTPSNIGVGSSLAKLRKVYGTRLIAEENPYAGEDYFVYSRNGNGIKFHIDRDKVIDMTVGSQSIRYVEGCL